MSEVSDLSFVIDDGILSEAWTIIRSTGAWIKGGWTTFPTNIPAWGVVSVANEEDLAMLKEADRITGTMVFHTVERIYETQFDPTSPPTAPIATNGCPPSPSSGPGIQRVSDIMLWNFQQWRVLHVGPYPNRNYWKALAVRMQGN